MSTKIVSDQTADIYRLLNDNNHLTAKQVAKHLGILPNAVYRTMNKLVELGMAEKISTYPVTFRAVPTPRAINHYLVNAAQNFRREFQFTKQVKHVLSDAPQISLIRDRDSMLGREDVDVKVATKSVDFIVSGLIVPDTTVLAFRKAATVGVKIRAIVQQKRETTREKLEKWHDLGANVKYLPDLQMRMVIIDNHITYLTSYDPKNRNSAYGVRLDYAPFAVQMSELFELNWQNAQDLKI